MWVACDTPPSGPFLGTPRRALEVTSCHHLRTRRFLYLSQIETLIARLLLVGVIVTRRSQMEPDHVTDAESFNPWSIVNLVFHHLAEQGLHPVLGRYGDPAPHAAALLVALGVEPAAEGNRQVMRDVHQHLSTLRTTMLGEP
jgi:hypothetical protein